MLEEKKVHKKGKAVAALSVMMTSCVFISSVLTTTDIRLQVQQVKNNNISSQYSEMKATQDLYSLNLRNEIISPPLKQKAVSFSFFLQILYPKNEKALYLFRVKPLCH